MYITNAAIIVASGSHIIFEVFNLVITYMNSYPACSLN